MIAVNNKVVRCCVHCSECGDCYTHTIYELRDLLIAIDIEVSNYGKAFAQKINQGYACFNLSQEAVDKILHLKETVLRYYHGMRTKAMMCLCNVEFQRIKEKIGRIIDLHKCARSGETDIIYDYSAYNEWVAENPTCVAYDVWEKGMVACNPTFSIMVKTVNERVVRTLHAIVSRDNSKCAVKLLAYANKAKCDRKIVASASDPVKCKAELKVLVNTHKCDISLTLYSRLLECNLSFKVISTLLECGGKFSLDSTGSPIVKIGATSSRVDEVIKLSGGEWQGMNEEEFNQLYA